jgi:hypothetical protein
MAAIAITQNSAEIAKSTASLNSGNTTYLKTDEYSGRVRLARFSFYPAAAVAATAVIALVRIPYLARIIQGKVASNGAVATATLEIGAIAQDGGGVIDPAGPTADATNIFATSIAVATAGEYFFGHTVALKYGYEVQAPGGIYVACKVNTAGFAGTGDGFEGHVLYVKD